MGNELTVEKPMEVITPVDMAQIIEYLDSTGLSKQLLPKEKSMFVNMAQLYGLNPFKREIYCTVYGKGEFRQCAIVTGYEVYLKRAERIGKLDGWHTEESGSIKDGSYSVKVTIYRKDWKYPFEHTVYYEECVQKKGDRPNAVWARQPRFMTKKVAVAQAFRMCFPDEFGGMPYLNDEMGVEETAPVVDVTPKSKEPTGAETVREPVIAPVPQEALVAEDVLRESYMRLEQLLDEFGLSLQGAPYKMASDCLKKQGVTQTELDAMYNRCVTYLKKKGVKIA